MSFYIHTSICTFSPCHDIDACLINLLGVSWYQSLIKSSRSPPVCLLLLIYTIHVSKNDRFKEHMEKPYILDVHRFRIIIAACTPKVILVWVTSNLREKVKIMQEPLTSKFFCCIISRFIIISIYGWRI